MYLLLTKREETKNVRKCRNSRTGKHDVDDSITSSIYSPTLHIFNVKTCIG